jgi:polysaccharide biosynthesis transport protein
MERDTKTVSEYIEVVKRRKWSLVIPAVALFVAAACVALLLPRVYRSTSTILIEEQEIPRELVMATVTSYAEQRLQAITQRVMSATKLLEIINRFNLYADLRKEWTSEEVITKMRKDIKFATISSDVVDRRTGRPTAATIAFSVSYDGNGPETVLQVANVLASLYLEENLKAREQQTAGTSRFLGDEAKTVREQLTSLEAKIARFKEKHIETLPELLAVNLQTMDRIEREMDQVKDQIRTLKEREGYLQIQLASIPVEADNQDRMLLKELKARLVQLSSRASDKHPDVIKARAEISELEKRLQKAPSTTAGDRMDNPAYVTLASQLAGTQSDIESAKRQLDDLTKKREQYRRRTEATPRVDEEYKNLMTERNNAQLKYDDLMKKTMEAKVAQGMEKEQMGERFTIVDPARLPEKPVSPNVPAILLIGLFLGIGAGVGNISLKEFSDQSFRTERELSALAGFPVLASISEIVTEKDQDRRRAKNVVLLFGAVAVVVIGLLAIHFLVEDLTVLWARIARRLL